MLHVLVPRAHELDRVLVGVAKMKSALAVPLTMPPGSDIAAAVRVLQLAIAVLLAIEKATAVDIARWEGVGAFPVELGSLPLSLVDGTRSELKAQAPSRHIWCLSNQPAKSLQPPGNGC